MERSGRVSVAETDNNGMGTTQGVTVTKFMEDHVLPRIDVLKMDIEGTEALIFSRDAHPEQFLSKVRFVALEIHEKTRPANRSSIRCAKADSR